MKKEEYLKSLSSTGVPSGIPVELSYRSTGKTNIHKALIPVEAIKPRPLDMCIDLPAFRRDIREAQTGVSVSIRLKIVQAANNIPISNARIDLWHCNALGIDPVETDNTNNYPGSTPLQGTQMTDGNGEAEFLTIFPGQANGEEPCINFRVFLSSVFEATGRFGFPAAVKNALYAAHHPYSAYYDHLASAAENQRQDDQLIAALTYNPEEALYEVALEIPIQIPTDTTLLHSEPETGGQFSLQQNNQEQVNKETIIPFTLAQTSDVRLELFDMSGKRMLLALQKNIEPGNRHISLNLSTLGIAGGKYIYQLQVTNANGSFRQCKLMNAL